MKLCDANTLALLTMYAACLGISGCVMTTNDLAACRFEAEKVIAPIEFQYKDQIFWKGEQRAMLVRPCMEAKGYMLDSEHVNRIAAAKGFLIENIISFEPSVWIDRFGRTDKSRIPNQLQS